MRAIIPPRVRSPDRFGRRWKYMLNWVGLTNRWKWGKPPEHRIKSLWVITMLGKTYLTAVFCVVRCILYPGTKICVASKTLKQAKEVLKKITSELMPNSANLRLEIKQVTLNSVDAQIEFKNGSIIFVTTATDTARGARCHILINKIVWAYGNICL